MNAQNILLILQAMNDPEKDVFHMKRALRLARRGEGRVSPNPMVGAVLVKNGRIIGEGYHERFGGPHAEVNAFDRATESPAGATLYVTLEPCSHQGKTPPCVDRILRERPVRVVVGVSDPNPLVAGRGLARLREEGIAVTSGVLERECRAQNEAFFKFMETGLPFVTVKFAQTLDGRIATATGHSRWVSSGPSLKYAHRLRSLHDAILVGAGTVRTDDPDLRVRLVRGRNPLRVVLDSSLSLSPEAGVFRNLEEAETVVFATDRCDREIMKRFRDRGIEVAVVPAGKDGRVDLSAVLRALAGRGVSSLLVEGGSAVITSFVREGLADRFVAIVASKLAGRGIETVGDLGILAMDEAFPLRFLSIRRSGEDVVLDARPRRGGV